MSRLVTLIVWASNWRQVPPLADIILFIEIWKISIQGTMELRNPGFIRLVNFSVHRWIFVYSWQPLTAPHNAIRLYICYGKRVTPHQIHGQWITWQICVKLCKNTRIVHSQNYKGMPVRFGQAWDQSFGHGNINKRCFCQYATISTNQCTDFCQTKHCCQCWALLRINYSWTIQTPITCFCSQMKLPMVQ